MTNTIRRKDFVDRFMRQCNMSFTDACRAFDCMCEVMKDGVVNGAKIRMGKLGVLHPSWSASKEVHMGVRVVKGRRYVRKKHVYFLSKRLNYRLRIFRKFLETHELNWFAEEWPAEAEVED